MKTHKNALKDILQGKTRKKELVPTVDWSLLSPEECADMESLYHASDKWVDLESLSIEQLERLEYYTAILEGIEPLCQRPNL